MASALKGESPSDIKSGLDKCLSNLDGVRAKVCILSGMHFYRYLISFFLFQSIGGKEDEKCC